MLCCVCLLYGNGIDLGWFELFGGVVVGGVGLMSSEDSGFCLLIFFGVSGLLGFCLSMSVERRFRIYELLIIRIGALGSYTVPD